MATLPLSLAAEVRQAYHASHAAALASGQARPFLVPLTFLGPFVLPIVWTAIPHTAANARSSLLAWPGTKWAVVAACAALDCRIILGRTTSEDPVVAYGAGMLGAWALMTLFAFVVAIEPQEDAARVMREGGGPAGPGGAAECRYYWQAFPAQAPLSTRLNWAFDLFTNFRGIGWNWGVRALPGPAMPPPGSGRPADGSPVDVASIPLRSRHGYSRSATRSDFLRSRAGQFAVCYLATDLLFTVLRHDPYFVLGPPGPGAAVAQPALPAPLAALPSRALYLYRILTSFALVIIALHLFTAIHDLVQYFVVSRFIPIRDEPWQHPSLFGGFDQVLDRGMAGFWGSWWHQSFRVIFTAPARYLAGRGLAQPGSGSGALANLTVPFLLSGLLHASASRTMPGLSRAWMPILFFGLCCAGLVVQQQMLCLGPVRALARRLPAAWRRVGNLGFVFVWLVCTAWLFADDLAASGFILAEIVPFSVARLVGLGHPGESWNRARAAGWYRGRSWWETGLVL